MLKVFWNFPVKPKLPGPYLSKGEGKAPKLGKVDKGPAYPLTYPRKKI